MKRSTLFLWVLGGGVAFVFFIFCLLTIAFYFSAGASGGLFFSGNQVAVLDLEGTILDSRDFVDQLNEYGNRPNVQSVVLRINSPGGGVAASQEIYESIKKFRAESQKHVVVSMASVAASGGYYVACAADTIYANPGSVTGSIGVITEWYNYGDLLQWAKLKNVVIKTGPYKDTGSSTRPLTDEERAYIQAIIDSMHEQFISAVASSRSMNEEDVRELADGRVFTGLEAYENGLVDEIGTYEDAIAEAARLAGIEGEPNLLRPVKKRITLLDLLLGDMQSILTQYSDRSESHIRFEYLWR